MTPKATLDRLRELDGKATKAPWRPCIWDAMERPHVHADHVEPYRCGPRGDLPITKADAELIAEMRNALPQLLADAETLAQIRALRERMRREEYYWADEFGSSVMALLDATTSSGHMTTKQKGDQ